LGDLISAHVCVGSRIKKGKTIGTAGLKGEGGWLVKNIDGDKCNSQGHIFTNMELGQAMVMSQGETKTSRH